MKKNLNKEYERLNKCEKIYDGDKTIFIDFDDDEYDYHIYVTRDRHYDYYEGRYID